MHRSRIGGGDGAASRVESVDGVTGTFRRRADAARALERLAAESVPPDAVRVWEVSDDGTPRREVQVRDDPGATSGALLGALLGASLGLVVVLLGLLGVFGLEDNDAWPTRVIWAVVIVGGSAAVGAVIGSAAGLGRWGGRERLEGGVPSGGAVMVRVQSDERSDVARRVLQEAGAEQVTP